MEDILRKKIEEFNKKKGYGIEDKDIFETLVELGKILKESDHDQHRWYTAFYVVKQIEDFFVQFQTYENSGDEPALDKEEWQEMVLESAKEVKPHQRTVIDYK